MKSCTDKDKIKTKERGKKRKGIMQGTASGIEVRTCSALQMLSPVPRNVHKEFWQGLAISKNFLRVRVVKYQNRFLRKVRLLLFPEGLKNRRGGIFVK